MSEADYELGNRAAWLAMLAECLRHLGVDDVEAGKARWVKEREETIAQLRILCDVVGDNNWTESLYLADVVEKHLARHLL
jgi:hypothetical protein